MAGQKEEDSDSQKTTARRGQLVTTARTTQPEQDSQNETAITGQVEQDRQNRTAATGLPG
jgi:hypothetical protein